MKNAFSSFILPTLGSIALVLLVTACDSNGGGTCDDCPEPANINLLGGTTTAGTYKTAAVSSYGDLAVAAFQQENDEVRLASYRVSGNSVKLLNTEDFGTVSKVNIALVSKDQAVVAVRNTQNQLHLIPFNIGADGSFTRPAFFDKRHVDIKDVKPSIISLQDGVFLTGAVNMAGNLVLSRWTITPTGVIAQWGNDYLGNSVTELDIARVHATRFVISTRSNASSVFNAHCFDVSATNQILPKGVHNLQSTAKSLSVVSAGNNQVVVFNTNASNQLASNTLLVDNAGNLSSLDNNPPVTNPATAELYTLKRIDAQFLGNGIILINAINSADRHVVIPFRIESSGDVVVQKGEYASSTDLFDLAYSTAVQGKLLTCNRLQSSQKYRLDLFDYK